jgi:Asp-tRNA(Asn)/Glu-tRNA(Gln) amidotransferase A subunit family amidase
MMSNDLNTKSRYDLVSVKLPTLKGIMLRIFTWIMESRLSFLVESSLLDKSGISAFRRLHIDEPPTPYPVHEVSGHATTSDIIPPDKIPLPGKDRRKGFRFNTVNDYYRLYSEGKTTPKETARKLIESITESERGDKPLRAFLAYNSDDIMSQAEASEERFRHEKPLSVLDGIPITVKDQLDVKGYPTTDGTSFLGKSPALEDSTAIARLRKTGAIIAGKTNMQELGMGVSGHNSHHGVVRNPYNTDHYTGGSSSGSAAAVAAGLGVASVGADGGGSIRIPSALCGVVGLKPTYGRISMHVNSPLCWSVEHFGPISATVADTAILYSALAGPDPADTASLRQPPPVLPDIDTTDISNLTIGIFPEWFNHADSEIVSICESLVKQMESMGLKTREISISGLESGRVAHTITIASEIASGVEKYYKSHRHDYGLDLRLNLAMVRKFSSSDYLKSQRVRTRMMAEFKRVFSEVDVIITPATGIVAPAIPESTLPEGESNLTELFEIMRFMFPANLTGLPAISFPAGYTNAGLPVGIQAIGNAWQEHTLLRLAAAAETVVERKAPSKYFDLLKDFR